MGWYAAHIIMYPRFKDGIQDKYPVWENVFLIEAASEEDALGKASEIGREGEGNSDGTFLWEARPAVWVFAGIRKLIECVGSEARPTDGTEITYSQMEVDSESSLSKLINGEPVDVRYDE